MDDVTRMHTITYGDFFRDFLLANQLCVFSSEITEDWRSRKEWVTNGKPNLEFLSNRFGHAIAPVANCSQAEYNSQVKQDMSVTEFCDYWKSSFQDEKNKTEVLYLKDWHFCKTPFHADVFRSYSWSANICGCKKWLLYPPGQEKYLTDRLGNLAYDILSDDMSDGKKFPDFDKARKLITVIQREGEVIFVPSGWHHQVMNLEDTISINHNWTNACGIFKMWKHVQSELKKVQQSIEDCKDMENWHEQCQMILKASCGINYEEFIEFLNVIARRRLAALLQRMVDSSQREDNDEKRTLLAGPDFESYVFEDWKTSVDVLDERQERTWADYCRYDLSKIKECLTGVKSDQFFNDLQNLELQSRVDKLLLDIDISNQLK
ncbi:2-oxoglutarate and iron-dependent oxygenase JMJD4-like isoform X3 [Acropora muricata]|uniref:2-oxoglutarate and iron-dependent oxygenase JMJD4-like isoform X3 n=1 Tax=Acropora muricata TaxID=159855 RepID=UPI0034E5706A